MALFSVYLPNRQTNIRKDRVENAYFVRDGFCWLAFFVPLIWLLAHRMWRWFLIVLVFDVVLGILGARFGLASAFITLTGLLAMLFVGLEARHWYGLALERRGFTLADIVQADTLEEAEYRFYEHIAFARPPAPPTHLPQPPRGYGVIGLFPSQGSR